MNDLPTTPELVSETVKEPAKRWRNWWRGHAPYLAECDACGARWMQQPGLVGGHCRLWPSKDVAETKASRGGPADRDGRRTYLGAFPEGERP